MKLEDYIEMLQRKLLVVGNVEVVMTQAGYYADGAFADLYQDPELEQVTVKYRWDGPDEKETFLVLGHSYQSY